MQSQSSLKATGNRRAVTKSTFCRRPSGAASARRHQRLLEAPGKGQNDQDNQNQSGCAATYVWTSDVEPSAAEQYQQDDKQQDYIHRAPPGILASGAIASRDDIAKRGPPAALLQLGPLRTQDTEDASRKGQGAIASFGNVEPTNSSVAARRCR